MVKCNSCGFENNDGSQICLNCRQRLDQSVKQASNAEAYIQADQKAISDIEKMVRKNGKTAVTVFVVILVAAVLGVLIYFANLYKPVVDTNLLGSWQYNGYGYTDVWTFEKDGSYRLQRTGTGIFSDGLDEDGLHYKAEDGRLKTSWSKNVDEYLTAIYEYQFGVSEDGKQCLILKRIENGGVSSTEILIKVQ